MAKFSLLYQANRGGSWSVIRINSLKLGMALPTSWPPNIARVAWWSWSHETPNTQTRAVRTPFLLTSTTTNQKQMSNKRCFVIRNNIYILEPSISWSFIKELSFMSIPILTFLLTNNVDASFVIVNELQNHTTRHLASIYTASKYVRPLSVARRSIIKETFFTNNIYPSWGSKNWEENTHICLSC